MSDSESSVLSSPPASDDEKLAPIFMKAKGKKSGRKVKKSNNVPAPTPPSPPRPKRSPSPEHEQVLADNADIAFIVMFRSRFSAAFPSKLAHVGPQDIERGVVDEVPSPQIESLLCAVLALVLNRKKPIESGHHGRALEEAISHNKHQWPKSWNGSNLVPGSKTFNSLAPAERLNLLRTLVIWSLTSSDEISKIIKDSYKQTRQEDDLNQPLSVQAWGLDDDKRKYWLIEGQDDTSFRLYREGNRALKNIPWRSVAGNIDEVKAVAEILENKHHTQASRRLATRINSAIPRFEATDEKRRRREYRQIRKAQFTRPEPGFSLYEGRTRGAKRVKYTFDDGDDGDNDFDSDAPSTRRSTRHHSDNSTPAEIGPTVTASGRTVRPRGGGMYGESLLSGQTTGAETGSYAASELSDDVKGRATRAGNRASNGRAVNVNGKRSRFEDFGDMSDESEEEEETGDRWDGGEDFEDEKEDIEDSAEDDDMSEDNDDDLEHTRSLVVKLRVGKKLQEAFVSNGGLTRQEKPETEEQPPPVTTAMTSTENPAGFGADDTHPAISAAHPVQVAPKQEEETSKLEPMDIDPPQKAHHPLPLDDGPSTYHGFSNGFSSQQQNQEIHARSNGWS